MNLLIVDDQVKVVQGLLNSVDWKAYGIDGVFGAYSVASAMEIFDAHTIDVLLCDIEMPIENGLMLVSWVNQKQLDTRCILLTAHAKFSYAQQSVKLHVFDYILQPAPYETIASCVQRAVCDLVNCREQKHLTDLGETFVSRETAIVGSALCNWLNRSGNLKDLSAYSTLGKLPTGSQPCALALLQILRWTKIDDWTPELLAAAFHNIAEELFAACGQKTVLAPMNEEDYALLIWSDDLRLSRTALEQQFNLFLSVCQKYFGCVMALYIADDVIPSRMVDTWNRLEHLRLDNVSRQSEVFYLGQAAPLPERAFRMPEISLWAQQLKGDNPGIVEQEADELLSQEHITAKFLNIFYQDFLLAFHNALGTRNEFWRETLSNPDNFKIYCEAPASVEQMKRLIHLIVEHFRSLSVTPSQELLQKIDSYIDSHMEEEISRQALANHVYLNADYLNRVVRQATGHSLKDYVAQRKLSRARMLLLTTHLPVAIIASKVGYGNAAHFSVSYKKQFGVTPMQTRHQETS